MDASELKQALRTKMKQLRKSIDAAKVEQASNLIVNNCLDGINWESVKSIQIYLPIADHKEVDTWPLIRHLWKTEPHVSVSVPVMRNGRLYSTPIKEDTVLQPAQYGTIEPLQPTLLPGNHKFDVVIVPVLGFDRRGHRLGYGKGYYDRFLNELSAIKIGFAYAESEVKPNIPSESHDATLNYVSTEEELLKCKQLH